MFTFTPLIETDAGEYMITVKLKDNHNSPKSNVYAFLLTVLTSAGERVNKTENEI